MAGQPTPPTYDTPRSKALWNPGVLTLGFPGKMAGYQTLISQGMLDGGRLTSHDLKILKSLMTLIRTPVAVRYLLHLYGNLWLSVLYSFQLMFSILLTEPFAKEIKTQHTERRLTICNDCWSLYNKTTCSPSEFLFGLKRSQLAKTPPFFNQQMDLLQVVVRWDFRYCVVFFVPVVRGGLDHVHKLWPRKKWDTCLFEVAQGAYKFDWKVYGMMGTHVSFYLWGLFHQYILYP